MDKLTSPKIVKEVIDRFAFTFNKRLGQNFLIDENVLKKIIATANVGKDDNVMEIGPGIGTLTRELCEHAKKVLCIEIDEQLIPILKHNLEDYKNAYIKNEDFLKMDINNTLEEVFNNEMVKVVANLPYYVSTPILMKLLEFGRISGITIMVQKEVAERICAKPGKKDYGILSIASQFYSEPKIVSIVPSTVFMPKPHIDSALMYFDIRTKPPVEVTDIKMFFWVVKAAFGKRRKTILNALSSYCFNGKNCDKNTVQIILEKSHISLSERAEQLSIQEFGLLANNFNEMLSNKEN